MRIGVMLRDVGNQLDAPGIIVLNLTQKLLELDSRRQYVLFLPDAEFLNLFTAYPNAQPVVVNARSRFLWDQLAVPLAAHRERVDLLFHPKHSVPLFSRCKTVMHLRGDEYWVYPEHFERVDLVYQKILLPLICKKADYLIAESDSVMEGFKDRLGVPADKISRIYLAPSDDFHLEPRSANLKDCHERYGLPTDYILTVTRVVQGKKFYPGKNILRMLEAYRHSHARGQMKLVIVGRETRAFVLDRFDPGDDLLQDLVVLDAVPHRDLPAIYTMARFFVFPSIYESFGLPILEAMARGCATITSKTFSCGELAADAALLVDPYSTTEIQEAIDCLAQDPMRRQSLAAKGKQRAAAFTWRNSALATIELFDRIETESAGR